MLIFLPNCSFIICNKKKSDGFWGYPSDLCLFADNRQNPVTDKEESQINNKTINILYSYF